MYADPSLIRDHVVKLRFNDLEAKLISAWVEYTGLSAAEVAMVRKIAERDGVSVDVAATRLASEALARRVKKRTGKRMAKVYPIGGKR